MCLMDMKIQGTLKVRTVASTAGSGAPGAALGVSDDIYRIALEWQGGSFTLAASLPDGTRVGIPGRAYNNSTYTWLEWTRDMLAPYAGQMTFINGGFADAVVFIYELDTYLAGESRKL